MINLGPTALYYLRLIAESPRYYTRSQAVCRLLKQKLIEETGNNKPEIRRYEFMITATGYRLINSYAKTRLARQHARFVGKKLSAGSLNTL